MSYALATSLRCLLGSLSTRHHGAWLLLSLNAWQMNPEVTDMHKSTNLGKKCSKVEQGPYDSSFYAENSGTVIPVLGDQTVAGVTCLFVYVEYTCHGSNIFEKPFFDGIRGIHPNRVYCITSVFQILFKQSQFSAHPCSFCQIIVMNFQYDDVVIWSAKSQI